VLDGFSKQLAERDDIRLAIIDEASAYKDAQTKRHRIARMVFGAKDYLWLMTGTPTPNAPTDAYGLAKLVNNAWGKSFTTFRFETMHRITEFKWVPQKDGYDKARRLLSPSIRFDISQVWDAPPTTTQVREAPLTAQQVKLLAQLKRDLQIEIKPGQPIAAVNEAAARMKFMQIAAGAVYDGAHVAHAIDAEPRLNEIETVCEETTRKVVIFVGLTSIVHLLYKRLSKRWSCAILNGEVAAKERADVIRRFGLETDDLRIVLCDPQATAHGINEMVTADTCIWATPTDKTELYLQGIKRLVRPGQTHPTTIVQIVSTKLEREIFRRLEHNETMQGALLSAIEKGEW
jgi:SNF2 family DNA or RNA helicase